MSMFQSTQPTSGVAVTAFMAHALPDPGPSPLPTPQLHNGNPNTGTRPTFPVLPRIGKS